MDGIEKLAEMGQFMNFEHAEEARPAPSAASCPAAGTPRTAYEPGGVAVCGGPPDKEKVFIHYAALPGGKRMPLLKTLLTSACERDCYYCTFRAGHDIRRTTFKPDELAQTFLKLYQARTAEGLFLSSGMAGGGVRTQDRLLDTAEILRYKLGFKGYLHLKIMPGAQRGQVERAMQLADRVSINLEAPNSQRLNHLAPHKAFLDELLEPLKWVEAIRQSQPAYKGWNGRWPTTTTQFVVGGVGESDLELLTTTAFLHQQVRLARAYFSKFSPVEGTPLENVAPANPWREHRLYQASFLLRDYGFDLEELPFSMEGNLPLEKDPKAIWAQANLLERPLEINKADRQELLRVPGIGPKGVQAVLAARRSGELRSLNDLKRILGRQVNRAAPYVLINGRRTPQQLNLW